MVAVREHLILQRQERAAGVDEVQARQPVLRGDLLGPQVLLHGQREVRPALHGRIVRDDHALRALDHADARDDSRARRIAVVEIPGGERVQLEERRVGVDQPVDALPRGELAARAVAFDGLLAAAARDLLRALVQLRDERGHSLVAARELVGAALDLRLEDGHGGSLSRPPDAWISLSR